MTGWRRAGLFLLSVVEGARAGIPPEWIRAHVQVESSGRDVVTDEGGGLWSYGVMQVLPGTAALVGYEGPDAELVRPELSVRYGARYLARQLRRYDGDYGKAIIAYKAGTWDEQRETFASNIAYRDAVMACWYRC